MALSAQKTADWTAFIETLRHVVHEPLTAAVLADRIPALDAQLGSILRDDTLSPAA